MTSVGTDTTGENPLWLSIGRHAQNARERFSKFVAPAKRAKSLLPHRSADTKAEQEYQKGEIERSFKYYKEALGLGLKA